MSNDYLFDNLIRIYIDDRIILGWMVQHGPAGSTVKYYDGNIEHRVCISNDDFEWYE